MCDIINKYKYFIIVGIMLFNANIPSTAQSKDEYRYLKLTLGGGYGHYFNTFSNILDADIQNNRPSFCGKLLWQPEHRLRIGVESGYYFIYSTTRIETDNGTEKLTSNLKVIPIFISLSMKVINHLELNFASGWASMIYSININKSKTNKVVGHTYSMSNYAAGLSYYIPLGKRLEIATELKYLYLGKTDDYHISAFLNLSYKFKKWKVK